jgi:hypothetical protein
MTTGDFTKRGVAHGLKFGEFDALPAGTKTKLVRLMSRIAEKSYRRGLQHGTLDLTVDPAKLRFEVSLDKSPFTDGAGGDTAIERLFMECGALRHIGFAEQSP